MNSIFTAYWQKKIARFWDKKSSRQRLELILAYDALFLSVSLVSEKELQVARATSFSNQNYVIDREIQPFFMKLNLKQSLNQQRHSQSLKTALNAVFSKLTPLSHAPLSAEAEPVNA